MYENLNLFEVSVPRLEARLLAEEGFSISRRVEREADLRDAFDTGLFVRAVREEGRLVARSEAQRCRAFIAYNTYIRTCQQSAGD